MAIDTMDAISAMKRQKQVAESKSSGNNFLFFKLADKQRALIRPLCNLDSSAIIQYHHYFDMTSKRYIDAVCATMAGLTCFYCESGLSAETKRVRDTMEAREVFMLPVWLLTLQGKLMDEDTKTEVLDDNNNPIWKTVGYLDKETNTQKPVGGLRIMTLAFLRSAWAPIAELFLTLYEKGEPITNRDFIIERQGGDKNTKYVPSKKEPRAFKIDIGDAPTTRDAVYHRVLQAAPMMPTDSDEPVAPQAAVSMKKTTSNNELEMDEDGFPRF